MANVDSTKPKPFCFVLMPFDAHFDDVYQLGIKAACTEAGAYSERVDEQMFDGGMLERIYNQIAKADLVIADMTGRNPNVFYEVGYAHALGKRTILITKSADDIPFDLKHYPHVIYGDSILELKGRLRGRVSWGLSASQNNLSDKFPIDIFCQQQNISSDDVIIIGEFKEPFQPWCDSSARINFVINNCSDYVLNEGSFKFAIICQNKILVGSDTYLKDQITVPILGEMHVFGPFKKLYPSEYINIIINIDVRLAQPMIIPFKVRVLSDFGSRDYDFNINFIKSEPW